MEQQLVLVRKCDKCGMVTAIDLDNTYQHKQYIKLINNKL